MFKKIILGTFVFRMMMTPIISKAEMAEIKNNQMENIPNEQITTDESLKSPEEIEYDQKLKEQKKLAKILQKKTPGLTNEQALEYAKEVKEYKSQIDNINSENEEQELIVLDP